MNPPYRIYRYLLGFLVAPLGIALLALPLSLVDCAFRLDASLCWYSLTASIKFVVLSYPFCLVVQIILGIPVIVFLRSRSKLTRSNLVFAGVIVGTLVGLLFTIFSKQAESLSVAFSIWSIGIGGLLGGLVAFAMGIVAFPVKVKVTNR
jgi:hypothetical protein